MIQFPHILSDICIVITSEEGTGKDLFFDYVGNTIGDKYHLNTDKLDSVTGKFNCAIAGKIFVVINETNPKESSQRSENIKNLVTAKKLLIEGKYKDPVTTTTNTTIASLLSYRQGCVPRSRETVG